MTQTVGNSVRNLARTWSALLGMALAIFTVVFVLAYGDLTKGLVIASLVLSVGAIAVAAAAILRKRIPLLVLALLLAFSGAASGGLGLKTEKPRVDSLQQVHGGAVVHEFEFVHVDEAQLDHVRDQHPRGAERQTEPDRQLRGRLRGLAGQADRPVVGT